ncbi:hypothetical protein Goari_021260, partial [Gossypium aridum]|nr:hypothetical protein [Gossypium aridum]
AHLVQALKKKWFLPEKRRTEEWEVREKFNWVELAERELKIEQVAVTRDEMEMYVDLHPLTNTTPFTVVESLSVAKALVLFRQVGLRHLLIVPKYQGAGVSLLTINTSLLFHAYSSIFVHLTYKVASAGGSCSWDLDQARLAGLQHFECLSSSRKTQAFLREK